MEGRREKLEKVNRNGMGKLAYGKKVKIESLRGMGKLA
jgi:hypothetical protein